VPIGPSSIALTRKTVLVFQGGPIQRCKVGQPRVAKSLAFVKEGLLKNCLQQLDVLCVRQRQLWKSLDAVASVQELL